MFCINTVLLNLDIRHYLDVNVVAAVLDDLDIGVVDGLFIVLDASRPVRGGAKDLTGSKKSVRVLTNGSMLL